MTKVQSSTEKTEVPFMRYTNIDFKVDPIQDDQIRDQMARNGAFAEMLYRNKTKLFFDFLNFKAKYRENISLEIKGGTRSGKSTMGLAIAKYISTLTGVDFDTKHICPNEIAYLQRVKQGNVDDATTFLIDEQTETHTGSGSYAEMMVIEDLANIIAKRCINTLWLHPEEFVGRNSQLGIETYGKDVKNKLIRGILYNLSQGALTRMPMGYIIIPIGGLYSCEEFGKPTIVNGRETITTCGSLTRPICPNYKKCNLFMAKYEKQKDKHIEQIKSLNFSQREMQRLDIAEALAKHPQFKKAKKKSEKISVARLLVPFGTPEKLILELVDLATSTNLDISELKNIKPEPQNNSSQLED
jgi:hypothetical protein